VSDEKPLTDAEIQILGTPPEFMKRWEGKTIKRLALKAAREILALRSRNKALEEALGKALVLATTVIHEKWFSAIHRKMLDEARAARSGSGRIGDDTRADALRSPGPITTKDDLRQKCPVCLEPLGQGQEVCGLPPLRHRFCKPTPANPAAPEKCPRCGGPGWGWDRSGRRVRCQDCGGTGKPGGA